ncbi:MBOAT family O-acyltransferase [Butyrivibrio proteoclasticus]|uniref:MBOAT family O-acyltransferase n=1 Tax=Butyrivibrio proteoclasticus TaxID=43305 RepID=UPI000686CFD8|nr:MBOAT family O-acyltransferase [Butyrivibrio proteoclasticus]
MKLVNFYNSVYITYVGGIVLGKRKQFFSIFVVLLFVPLVAYKILDWNGTGVLLPLGISFFTLQAYTYLHDVRDGSIEAEKSLVTVALFVAFFPAVSSGPILRARTLIPQLKASKEFDYDRVTAGMKLYCFGLFKKLVLADNMAVYIQNVNTEFAGGYVKGLAVLLSAMMYSLQLYLDFSGYSDIVIGSARILGFDIDKNFDHPYLARTISEFWRRWHISLSSWLRDYVYFPLGGSRKGQVRTYLNIVIVFLVSGLWHGNGWNFIVWGLIHGVFQCAERMLGTITRGKYKGSRVLTFIMATFAWMFFSAASVGDALGKLISFGRIPGELADVFGGAASLSAASLNAAFLIPEGFSFVLLLAGLIVFGIISLITYKRDGIELVKKIPAFPRWLLYNLLILSILFFAASEPVSFIYNKF